MGQLRREIGRVRLENELESVPPDVPPLEHFPLMFACVRRRSHPSKLKKNEHQRTATNNLHLTGGQGVVGSNPASPTEN